MEDKRLEQFNLIIQRIHKHKMDIKHTCNIHASEFGILKLISSKDENPITITEISEKMHISKPAVSQIINALEEKEYVKRVYTKADRRVVYVDITEKGIEAIDFAVQQRSEMVKKLLDKLGEEDAETFLRLFEKISNIIREI